MTIETWTQFIKAHEKLIIVIIAAFLLYRTGQGIENGFLHRNDQKAVAAESVVTNDAATNKQLTDQLAQLKQSTDKQATQLNQDMASKLAALKQQQALDQQATQQQIIDRWKLLQPMKPGAVQVNGVVDTITPEAATQTVESLEQIPVLKLQVTDLSMELLAQTQEIVKQDNLIAGLNTQLVDEKKSHIDDVNLEKSKAHRSWRTGFKWGFIAGAVSVEAIRVWAGHP